MNSADFAIASALDAANRISTFVEGVNREHFLSDELRIHAVTANVWSIQRSLERIPNFDLPWSNVAPSELYYEVDSCAVWEAATVDVPELISSLLDLDSGGKQ